MSKLKTQINSFRINPEKETAKIIRFIRRVFQKTNKKKAVLGWSGGIDSTVCLYLLARSIDAKNIYVFHLPYYRSQKKQLHLLAKQLKIPKNNCFDLSINRMVDTIWDQASSMKHQMISDTIKTRLGNIIARVRMIFLFDQAKASEGLVCGTENRTENLLGYFTRYGDSASDIEPISHLFKTQIYQLADYLKINNNIIKRTPSADLWKGQTDEGEFGFTYKEADEVLYRFIRLCSAFGGTMARQVDLSRQIKLIKDEGLKNTKKIIEHYNQNKFKRETPYVLD